MRLARTLRAAAAGAVLASAQVAAASAEERQLTAVQLFELAEAATAEGRAADAEAMYAALIQDADGEVRAEARFRLALLQADQRRYAQAAVTLRALLDEKPDATRVRLELARVLALAGEEGAARRQLRQAQAAGLPREVAAAVNQFAGALRARQPFGGSLSFAIVPDSNVNRATEAKTLDTVIAPLELTEDARSRSGIGLRVGGQAYARVAIRDGLTILPRVSAQAELYRERQFNDMSGSVALGAEFASGRNRIRPSIAHTVRHFGGRAYARTESASLNWLRGLGRTSQADVTISAARADYQLNDLQDGWLFDLSVAYERAFDARSGGNFTLIGSRQAARDPGYSTKAGGASLLYWRELGRLTIFGSVGLRRLEADERLLLFPQRRQEWLSSVSVGSTVRHLSVAGFAPLIRVSFERNASSIGIYDYRRTAVDFGIMRAF
jgi:outer membrane protein